MLGDFEAVIRRISEKRGIRFDFSCPIPCIPVFNRPEDFGKVRRIVTGYLGGDAFCELPAHVMTSEDFSWYLEKYRGVFCHLGSGDSTPLHSDRYDFDDRLLECGIRYFCVMALHGDEL